MPDAISPLPNVGSQLDRAVVALLISLGCGTAEDTYPQWRNFKNVFVGGANTKVHAHTSDGKPRITTKEIFQVQITINFQAQNQPGETAHSLNRVNADKRIGLIMAALMQSDGNSLRQAANAITDAGRALATAGSAEERQANADMANFTCTDVYYVGAKRGEPDAEGSFWVEIRHFEMHAVPWIV